MRLHIHHHFDPEFYAALGQSSPEVLEALRNDVRKTMADADSILATVTANTDALASLGVAADALNEGQTSIEELIADLKKQIADLGTPVDLGPLAAAVENQATVIDGLKKAVVKGTELDPSANG